MVDGYQAPFHLHLLPGSWTRYKIKILFCMYIKDCTKE
jgi:hypothetical protein